MIRLTPVQLIPAFLTPSHEAHLKKTGNTESIDTKVKAYKTSFSSPSLSLHLAHLKKTDGTDSIDTTVSISFEQPSSAPDSSIFARAGSRGNSAMLHG